MNDRTVELDALLGRMVAEYIDRNHAAGLLKSMLDDAGVGLFPLIDHVTIRTFDIEQGAQPFVDLGYTYDETIEYGDWYAKVYRKMGYPALFVDQAYPDDRGKTSIIPGWVKKFGDRVLHHVAVRVECTEALKSDASPNASVGPAWRMIGSSMARPRS